MDTLNVKANINAMGNLEELTTFVTHTKCGAFTDVPLLDVMNIDKNMEQQNQIENILAYVETQQVLFFGLSY